MLNAIYEEEQDGRGFVEQSHRLLDGCPNEPVWHWPERV